MRKTINRIAYFLADYVNFLLIYLIFFATSLMIIFYWGHNKAVSETNIKILIIAMFGSFFIPYPFYWASAAIVSADLKKSIKKVKYKATAYSKKILRRNDDGETYYLIKIENETKIVKASTLLVNKQDKFADSQHKARTTNIEYIEIGLIKDFPEYKKELFNQRLTSNGEKKWKNQLNVINYVSTEV